jgi:hypothetical protein
MWFGGNFSVGLENLRLEEMDSGISQWIKVALQSSNEAPKHGESTVPK